MKASPMKSALFSLMAAAGVLFSPVMSMAVVEAVPVASDPRIKTITYGPDQVYKFTAYLRTQTSIDLGADEKVGTITIGDQTGWKISPSGNKIFIKPMDLDIDTNMMVITNKRTYLFELHADEVKAVDDPRLTMILRFVYPDEGDGTVMTTGIVGTDHVPDLDTEDLSKYNFRYTITGSEDISPIRIFDDGEFTFFEFRGINADIPAIFQVDKEGNEALINFRTRGHYIVVERVSARYTLRLGNQVVCVFNEAWGSRKDFSKEKTGGYSTSTSRDGTPRKQGTVLK